ncbi:MAG: TRAP transporter small permease subunit [Pseudomonadota bacterium]
MVRALIVSIDRFSQRVGHAVSWLTLAMVLVTGVVVVLRYFFQSGWIWLQELITWMHAMVFLLGAAYTLSVDEHVRVDVLYRQMSARSQALVNLLGTVLLLFPTCGFVLWAGWDYVVSAWQVKEASREAGGLPYPFVPLLKSAMLALGALLIVQGLGLLLRSVLTLVGPADRVPPPAAASHRPMA